MKKYIFAIACAALAITLAGCTNEKTPSSEMPESSAVSEISSAPVEEESSTFIPADDLISTAPGVIAGETEGFDYEFSQNPIDKQYNDDYAVAASFSMMRQACGDAIRRWETMIDNAYEAAVAATPEDEQYLVIQEHEQWLQELDGRLDTIRSEASDDNEGILSAEKQIVLLYREHAMELCKIKYDIDGTLPDFPDEDSIAAAG